MTNLPSHATDFGAFWGCGRKLRPGHLRDFSGVLDSEPNSQLPQVAGLHQLSDVGQARLPNGDIGVQTVDIVLPLPVSPEVWGVAAALHCASDVYASGAEPSFAVGIVEARTSGSSAHRADLATAYRSAVSALNADGIAVVGGHSLMGSVDKIGFAITGVNNGAAIRSVAHASSGDQLYLTKPIGSGAIFAAASATGSMPCSNRQDVEAWLVQSNRLASSIAHEVGLRCSSDVSGYGLLGTALQIAAESGTTVVVDFDRVPKLEGAMDGIRSGIVSSLAEAVWIESEEQVHSTVDTASMLLLCDPQVSGGLVLAVSPAGVARFEKACDRAGVFAVPFGEVTARDKHHVVVR